MIEHLQLDTTSGASIADHIDALAALRIRVFREYPYLYEGSEAYERRYLRTYVDSPDSILVTVHDGDQLVGATTGLPLQDETGEVRNPFEAYGMPVDRIFYLGESMLLPEYRGQGLGVRFFEERERHARALGGFTHTTFCAVGRPEDHPRRPRDYQPLDAFWNRRGYRRHPELSTEFTWPDLGGDGTETAKPMVFWLKTLA